MKTLKGLRIWPFVMSASLHHGAVLAFHIPSSSLTVDRRYATTSISKYKNQGKRLVQFDTLLNDALSDAMRSHSHGKCYNARRQSIDYGVHDEVLKSFVKEFSTRDELKSHCNLPLSMMRRIVRRLSHGPRLRRKLAIATLAIGSTMISSPHLSSTWSFSSGTKIQPANAANIMLGPARKEKTINYQNMGLIMAKTKARQKQAELDRADASEFNTKYREVQRAEGLDAADAYKQKSFKRKEAIRERQKLKKQRLIYDMIQQNIDPIGPIGQKLLFKFDYDVDLSIIPNTDQYHLQRMKESNREMFKKRMMIMEKQLIAKVERLKAANVNLIDYYLAMEELMDGETATAFLMAPTSGGARNQIKEKLDEEKREVENKFRDIGRSSSRIDYTLPPGEETPRSAREIAKEKKHKLKLEMAERAQRIKAEKQAAKHRLKEEKVRLKEIAKQNKERVKQAAKASKEVVAGAAAIPGRSVSNLFLDEPATLESGEMADVNGAEIAGSAAGEDEVDSTVSKKGATVTKTKKNPKESLSIRAVAKVTGSAAAIGLLGYGGVFAFNSYKGRSSQSESERKRNFNLIMGIDNDDSLSNAKPNGDETGSLNMEQPKNIKLKKSKDKRKTPVVPLTLDSLPTSPSVPASTTASSETSHAPMKKKRGVLGSIFKKQKTSGRETTIDNVFSTELHPQTAEYAKILASYLTVGAPGRFPKIESMSVENGKITSGLTDGQKGSFLFDQAKKVLVARREDMHISEKDAAETFANVVNAMIIDLIDLASSATEIGSNEDEKNKATVDALNVVLEFMEHAASMFDAVAKDTPIDPVVYEGSLSKTKLEQMFTAYAGNTMASPDENAQDRLDTLQQVFGIRDKKAEGLLQKVMMKNLMKMMKEGGDGGMEGMAEMMAAMGGGGAEGMMPGLGGAGRDGVDVSPEELKQTVQMMKQLVESGSVSPDELDAVKKQFKDMYGTDINELIAAADNEDVGKELGDDGKELIDLFKTVLDDTKK